MFTTIIILLFIVTLLCFLLSLSKWSRNLNKASKKAPMVSDLFLYDD